MVPQKQPNRPKTTVPGWETAAGYDWDGSTLHPSTEIVA
jgi:hypothetical protein